MGKKRKRKKKRSIVTNVTAIYKRGMELYLEEDNFVAGLKYLLRAAKAGYKPAYGEIGIILYREKNEADKAEKAEALFPEAAYQYGMLFYFEKGDCKTGLSIAILRDIMQIVYKSPVSSLNAYCLFNHRGPNDFCGILHNSVWFSYRPTGIGRRLTAPLHLC